MEERKETKREGKGKGMAKVRRGGEGNRDEAPN